MRMSAIMVGIGSGLCLSIASAGTMGGESIDLRTTPFISGEGSWTWLKSPRVSLNTSTLVDGIDHWGGRLAGGAIFPYDPAFGFTAETGWNYLGRAEVHNISSNPFTVKYSIDGADVLVGAQYKLSNWGFLNNWGLLNNLGVFLKAGTLFENVRYTIKGQDQAAAPVTIAGSAVTFNFASVRNKLTQSYALPEIKVGLLYDVNNRYGVTVSYMHAFGITDPAIRLNVTSSATPTTTTINIAETLKLEGLSMNSVFFGVYYKFC